MIHIKRFLGCSIVVTAILFALYGLITLVQSSVIGSCIVIIFLISLVFTIVKVAEDNLLGKN